MLSRVIGATKVKWISLNAAIRTHMRSLVTQAHCVCYIGKYRERMRRTLDLEIC